MNPRADASSRTEAMQTLLETRDEARFRATLEKFPVDLLLQTPADSSELRALDERYREWAVLKPLAIGDSAVRLYRVVRDSVSERP